MGGQASVGFFSRLRWGVGSTALVIGLTAVAAYLIATGLEHNDALRLFSGGILAIVDIIIIVAKGLERITPMKPPSESLVGRSGVVVISIRPSKPGVVRVDNELWSAISDLEIKEGSRVIVVERQGLYVKVKPVSDKNIATDKA
ncbi:hypothetical protein ASAC_0912 [Acidilobus saccharovorans 345-15]|uniref:NfeD-like C-terminal domain-containing protein n=1 Tax=Acidilobus saccharovorans (strain DSM 16705 / JCM 18335 / VKM B-2471 / 345-15) TaxID=666510 RepID=D9Q1Y0_ACIS3|nr:NfeD family protein [Acidilobus saccharovorans]ADL19318.1 hypothetical protein ASAC_0912 [Acidilobus saccharovorans 345-15]